MKEKIVSVLIFAELAIGIFALAFQIQPVKASTGTITIKSDGSIDPPTAPISTSDNITYTCKGDINNSTVVVQRDSIIIDGNKSTLQGNGNGRGIDLSGRTNVTVRNTRIKTFYYGIWLAASSNNTISENIVTNNTYEGIDIRAHSDHNTISGNNVSSNGQYGIWLAGSFHNLVTGNIVTTNGNGIWLYSYSDYNSISGNNVTANDIGIELYSSNYNSVAENTVTNNTEGINMDFAFGNTISGNSVFKNGFGITPGDSYYNTFSGNNVTTNNKGIYIYINDAHNLIQGNSIVNNTEGMRIYTSYDNTFSGNNLTNNACGINLISSSDNRIYHNNFMTNEKQIDNSASTNSWDDSYPSGGNYWSDYNGTDLHSGNYQNMTDSDGIGDISYSMNASNADNYPLMAPFHTFDVGSWNGTALSVDIVSDFTTSNLSFHPTEKALSFNATGLVDYAGFYRISIPKTLMWCDNQIQWSVVVNKTVGHLILTYYPPLNIITDTNYTYIYFVNSFSPSKITITSTSAIPEFQPTVFLPLFLISALLAGLIAKKNRTDPKKRKPNQLNA